MSRERFLKACTGRITQKPAIGPGTSIVSRELMDFLDAKFPRAHLDVSQMCMLAEAGHTIYGFDVVMPLFSVCHESAAIGCDVDWGNERTMPWVTKALWKHDREIVIPADFAKTEPAQVPLKAITELKKRLGNDAAVCGKVFGPWTLGYHTFGIEHWLISTLDDPDLIKRAIQSLKKVTIEFARAQIEAGADCILIGDHATRDLCSPTAYREFLFELHQELAGRISVPTILHICGDTADRLPMIATTGLSCFHWDTKLGSPEKARKLAGNSIALMGGINNPLVIRTGSTSDIAAQCSNAASAGIDILAPECAVPLDTPMKNLKSIGRYAAVS